LREVDHPLLAAAADAAVECESSEVGGSLGPPALALALDVSLLDLGRGSDEDLRWQRLGSQL
jgi:hypothetical protein